MGPADIGLVLLCCIKAEDDMQIRQGIPSLSVEIVITVEYYPNFRCQADFGRNSTLVPDLLKRLATLVMAGEAMTLH